MRSNIFNKNFGTNFNKFELVAELFTASSNSNHRFKDSWGFESVIQDLNRRLVTQLNLIKFGTSFLCECALQCTCIRGSFPANETFRVNFCSFFANFSRKKSQISQTVQKVLIIQANLWIVCLLVVLKSQIFVFFDEVSQKFRFFLNSVFFRIKFLISFFSHFSQANEMRTFFPFSLETLLGIQNRMKLRWWGKIKDQGCWRCDTSKSTQSFNEITFWLGFLRKTLK